MPGRADPWRACKSSSSPNPDPYKVSGSQKGSARSRASSQTWHLVATLTTSPTGQTRGPAASPCAGPVLGVPWGFSAATGPSASGWRACSPARLLTALPTALTTALAPSARRLWMRQFERDARPPALGRETYSSRCRERRNLKSNPGHQHCRRGAGWKASEGKGQS